MEERKREGGSLERRETKPVQVNKLAECVLGLAEREREGSLSLATNHKEGTALISLSFTLLLLSLQLRSRQSRDYGVALGEVISGHSGNHILQWA